MAGASPAVATADSVLQAADYAARRFREIGVKLHPQSRLSEARAVVERFARDPRTVPDLSLLGEATRCIFEFYFIARACGNEQGVSEPRLTSSLEWALSGALDLRDETHKNSRPRNTQFELFVGAWLTAGGANPRLEEPDLRVSIDTETLGIAAKRVRSRSKVVKRAKEGAEQILRNGQHGIVVLNVDALVEDIDPSEDADAAGEAFNLAVPEFAEAQDQLKDMPHVRGLWVMGTVVRWAPAGPGASPFLRMQSFRRLRFFPDTDDDVSRYNEFVAEFNALLSERMKRF